MQLNFWTKMHTYRYVILSAKKCRYGLTTSQQVPAWHTVSDIFDKHASLKFKVVQSKLSNFWFTSKLQSNLHVVAYTVRGVEL